MALTRLHRIWLTVAAIATPVAYMVALHLSWMKTREERIRMGLKHLGFWGGMAATIYTTHRFGFRAKTWGRALPIYGVAATFPALGYEIIRRLAKRWFPDKPKIPVNIPLVVSPETTMRPKALSNILKTPDAALPRWSMPSSSWYSRSYPASLYSPYPLYTPYYGNSAFYAVRPWG